MDGRGLQQPRPFLNTLSHLLKQSGCSFHSKDRIGEFHLSDSEQTHLLSHQDYRMSYSKPGRMEDISQI